MSVNEMGVAVTDTGDERVINQVSAIHGDGCFAREAFAAGETIGIFRGTALTATAAEFLEADGKDMHVLWVDENTAIDVHNALRHVNHAEDPNTEWDLNGEGEPELCALRPIAAGEEITMNYGEEWDVDELLGPEGNGDG